MPITNLAQITRMAELSGADLPGEIVERVSRFDGDPDVGPRRGDRDRDRDVRRRCSPAVRRACTSTRSTAPRRRARSTPACAAPSPDHLSPGSGIRTFWVGKNHNVPEEDNAPRRQPLDVAAAEGLRPVLRVPRRRDQQLVSRPRRGQPLHRPALHAPRRATTSPRTSPTRRCRCCATRRPRTPRSPGTCGSAPAPTTRRTTRPQEYIDKYKGAFDDGYEAYREWVLGQDDRARASCPRAPQLTPLNPMPEDVANPADVVRPWDDARRRREAAVRPLRRGLSPASPSTPTPRSAGSSTTSRRPGSSTTRWSSTAPTTARPGEGSPQRVGQREQVLQRLPRRPRREPGDASTSSAARTPTTTTRPAGRRRSRTPFQMFKRYAQYSGGTCDPMVIQLAEGHRGARRDPPPVPPRDRHRRRRSSTSPGWRCRRCTAVSSSTRSSGVSMSYSFDDARRPDREGACSTTRCSAPAASGRTAGRRRRCTRRSAARATSTRTAGSSTTSTRTARSRRTSPPSTPRS